MRAGRGMLILFGNLHRHPREGGTMESALEPGLQALIDRGLLSRAEAADINFFSSEVALAVSRGAMTPTQADAMGQMLGLRHARRHGRAERRLQ